MTMKDNFTFCQASPVKIRMNYDRLQGIKNIALYVGLHFFKTKNLLMLISLVSQKTFTSYTLIVFAYFPVTHSIIINSIKKSKQFPV